MLANELCKLGFQHRYRSATGSRYLAYDGAPFKLRISNHQWGNIAKSRAWDVVSNYVVTEPLTATQIEERAMRVAIRFIVRARQRIGKIRGGENS